MRKVQEVMSKSRDVEKPVQLPQAFYSLSTLTPKVEAKWWTLSTVYDIMVTDLESY